MQHLKVKSFISSMVNRMNNPLARQHNLILLERYQNWRLGNDDRTLDEIGLTPKVITAVIDWAIENLKRIEDDGK